MPSNNAFVCDYFPSFCICNMKIDNDIYPESYLEDYISHTLIDFRLFAFRIG
jgi:hypothetical protein